MRSGTTIGCILWVMLGAFLIQGSLLPSQAAASWGADYVFLVDNTGTMRYGERGAMTLVALCRFVDMMEDGDRISVFSYGEVARPILSPYPAEVTDEESKAEIRRQLAFGFDADRTDMTSGVELVWQEREKIFPRHCEGATGTAIFVLLTDGKLIPVYQDYSQYQEAYDASRAKLRELARSFGDEGIPVHTVGVGTTSKVDVPHLASIAEWSGGSSYHVTDASELPDIYAGIFESTRPQEPEPPVIEEETVALAEEPVEEPPEVQQPVVARHTHTVPPSTPGISGFDLFYRGTTGAIAVFLGLVVIGARRRQPWAEFFTRAIGPQEQRVRGYLKPVDPPGSASARAIIGIENPGLPTLEVGHGTPYASFVREALIEFVGTRDGTPPVMHVLRGDVTVDGEPVQEEQKLRDGQVITIEGAMYMYLRGSRR